MQEEHFGRKQQHDITGYNILPRGYCTYRNRSDGVDFTFNINKCCDKGIISKFYPVFYGNNSDVFFISLVLNHSEEVVHEIGYTCTGTGQKVLSFLDLLKMHITVPSYDEQKKIASYFEQLDTLITLHQRECFSFDFSGESAKTAQKTISWEQRKLGEISESFEYGLNAAATEYDGKHKYIRITDIDDSTHLFIQDNLTSPDIDFSTADDYLLQAGDVLFARTGASVGKTYIYRSSDGDLYFAGFLIRAKIKRDYDADFVFQNTLTDNYDSYIRITSQRSGQPGVNAQEYANFALSVPCLAEQKKIGAYFTNLDNLITLHQHKPNKKGHDVLSVMPFKGNQRKPHYLCT